ncbi:MAG TPA: ferritin-like domain-containing protein [Acidimicrobiales bacterium]|jgi:bacterioferritin (cytochrome b1)|nr:ferritin-like domain-containing protein [Acidimicrobiales bacterium]
MSDEEMDTGAVIDLLKKALRLQYRSALLYTMAAGSVRGLDQIAFADLCRQWAGAELDDARRVVEKVVALGGQPPTDVAPIQWSDDAAETGRILVDCEDEALEALHAVIPATGQEARSEALEHLMEHVILRKQQQIDRVLMALGDTE